MGISADNSEDMTSVKPRERQFQVVPVEGKFTRGRWQCWDYREEKSDVSGEILEFTDKTAKVAALPVAADSSNGQTCEGLTHTVSDPVLIAGNKTGVEGTKESSTILVTSIAPAPLTPQHGTPSSSLAVDTPDNNINQVSLDATQGLGIAVQRCVSPSFPAVPSNSFVTPSLLHFAKSSSTAALSRQTSLGSLPGVSTAPMLPTLDGVCEDVGSSGNAAAGANVVAIDNKIEQAMDLVKTHLTFAVREEVEILRSTIVDLEAKVAQLEGQNQVLKQFAPLEVVSNLALLVQNAQQHKHLSTTQTVTTPAPLSASLSNSQLSSTLNSMAVNVSSTTNSTL